MKLEDLPCNKVVYRFDVPADAPDFAGGAAEVAFWSEDVPGTWCVALFNVKDRDDAQAYAGQRNVAVTPSIDAARGILWAWLSYRDASDGLWEKRRGQ